MIYVEDALQKLYVSVIQDDLFISNEPDSWAFNFTINVSRFVGRDNPISTEQGRIVLKLFNRCLPFLVARGRVNESEARDLLANPVYKRQPYQSANIPREVRYLGDNLLGFRFKLNDIILEDIKRLRAFFQEKSAVRFDREHRIWVVPVTEHTYDMIREVIKKHRFSFDDAVAQFLAEAKLHAAEPPIIATDEDIIVVRVHGNAILAGWMKEVLGAEVV